MPESVKLKQTSWSSRIIPAENYRSIYYWARRYINGCPTNEWYKIDYETEEFGLGDVPRVFLEVGQGNLNWKAIREACIEAGCEWYNVEQDRTKRPVFESVKISIDFMRGELGIV